MLNLNFAQKDVFPLLSVIDVSIIGVEKWRNFLKKIFIFYLQNLALVQSI